MAEACNPPLSAAAGLDPSYCGVRRRDGGEEAALVLRRRKMEKPNGGASGRMRRDRLGGEWGLEELLFLHIKAGLFRR